MARTVTTEFDAHYIRERETFNWFTVDREPHIAELCRMARLLPDLLAMPFQWKVEHAQAVIEAALSRATAGTVAWSGGRGSTVLLHLVLQHRPDILVFFGDTGVEFPETRRFVREVAGTWNLNLHTSRPARDVSFLTIVREYGWPALGKVTASHSAAYHRRIAQERAAKRTDPAQGALFDLASLTTSRQALMAGAVRLSAQCCYHLKEKPQALLQRRLGVDLVLLGIQVVESEQRRKNYIDFGEFYYAKKGRVWKAHPLALWTAEDLIRYEAEQGVPVNPLYDAGHTRTGCWPCLMSLGSPHGDHLDKLLQTHPHLHRALMLRWGAGEVIARLKAVRQGLSPEAFVEEFGMQFLYERHPCWFNRL